MNGKKRTHQWRELIRRKRFDTNRKFGRDVLLPRPLLAVFLVVSGRGGARRARGITVTVRHQLLAREVVPVIDRLGMVTFGTKKKENRAWFFFPLLPTRHLRTHNTRTLQSCPSIRSLPSSSLTTTKSSTRIALSLALSTFVSFRKGVYQCDPCSLMSRI
jgi:hypothetical protein